MAVGPSSSATTLDTAAAAAAAVPAIHSFYNPSSTKRIMIDEERTMQQQDEQQQEPYEVPPYQLTIGLWSQRILGIIIVISSIFMFSLAWKRRDRLFHRLVLGTYRMYCLLFRVRIPVYIYMKPFYITNLII
jgi:hypothetical protein